MTGLAGKVAIISGASSDIGQAVCKSLLSKGVNIGGTYCSNPLPLERLKEKYGNNRMLTFKLDLLEPDVEDRIGEVIKKAIRCFQRIDFLVNVSGIWFIRPFLYENEKNEAKKLWKINYWGPYFFMQETIPYMMGEGGCIVNIASSVGARGGGQQASYGASKAALINLTKSVAEEFAPRKIRIVAISPGFVDTKALAKYFDAPLKELVEKRIPFGRFAIPRDIAHMVLFCIANPYITGVNLVSEGGVL
jgi:3-oxoacyl-[acyl-carrier protein] reductase